MSIRALVAVSRLNPGRTYLVIRDPDGLLGQVEPDDVPVLVPPDQFLKVDRAVVILVVAAGSEDDRRRRKLTDDKDQTARKRFLCVLVQPFERDSRPWMRDEGEWKGGELVDVTGDQQGAKDQVERDEVDPVGHGGRGPRLDRG